MPKKFPQARLELADADEVPVLDRIAARHAEYRRAVLAGETATLSTMTKYVPAGSVVDATEVTASNLDRLAEEHGGTRFTSPEGVEYAIFEGPGGSTRAEVGGFIVTREGEDGVVAFRNAEEFHRTYQRP